MSIYLQLEKIHNKFFKTEKSWRLKSFTSDISSDNSQTHLYINTLIYNTDTFILICFPIPTCNTYNIQKLQYY